MPQQLIFTSAVRGIAPGSSGYCTVARSVEMREGLVSRLEQLSVYQHLQNGVNPMVLSHRILSLRGAIFHVLSRTVDSGLDYTNRTNFIAHHVVFQPHELHGACSPGDFFLHWPGWLSTWEGDPAWTDDQAASLHSVQSTISLPAENWAGWSGNAGNASLLFESGRARDAALVVEPGQESALIYLFAESILLLGGNQSNNGNQWQVPFTTFFQSKDEVADFRWRGGWPEVNRAKAERGALVLDLRTPSGFPSASGTLAEWASSGIAPKPVTPEIASTAEIQPAVAEEEEKPASIPTSKQTRTSNFNQPSRKPRQPEHVQEATEEALQPWYWTWRWALLAGFAVTALILIASCVLLLSLNGRRDHIDEANAHNNLGMPRSAENPGQGSLSDNKLRTTPPPVVNPEVELINRYLDEPKTNNANTTNAAPPNSTKSPEVAKPLAATNNASPASPSQQPIPAVSQSTLKDDLSTTLKTNSTSVSPPTQTAEESKTLNFPQSFPKGAVYILFRNASTVDTTPIPQDLDTKLKTFKNTAEYSVSTTGFQNLAKCSCTLIPSSDGFVLKLHNEQIARYGSGSLSAPSDAFYLRATKGSETVSLMMIDASRTTDMFYLPKSFLNLSEGDISANEDLKNRLSQFLVFDVPDVSAANNVEKKRLNMQFIIVANNKSYTSDLKEFSISWKQAVQKAKDNWSRDKEKLADDQKNSQIEAQIKNVKFADIDAPLTLKNNDINTFATYLQTPGVSDINSKIPLLVQYAKRILSSLGTSHLNGNLNLIFDDPQPPGDWEGWLKKIPQDLPNKLLAGPAGIHDDEVDAFKSSLKSLCKEWTTTFTSPDAAQLLTLAPKSIMASLGSTSNLDADRKHVQEDEENQKSIHKEDISAVGVIVTPAGTASVQVIQFNTDEYHMVSQDTQGASK